MRLKALAIVFAILPFPSFFMPIGQRPACFHEDNNYFFEQFLRQKPIIITGFEQNKDEQGNKIQSWKLYWEFIDKKVITVDGKVVKVFETTLHQGSYELYSDTVITSTDNKGVTRTTNLQYLFDHYDKGNWAILYCAKCLSLFRVHQSPKGEINVAKQ